MSEQREIIFDIDDPVMRGIYRSFESNARASIGALVEKDSIPQKFRLVRRSSSAERFWDDVNTAGCQIRASLGDPHNVYATVTAWSSPATSSVSLVVRQTGTATQHNIQRIAFSQGLDVYDGNLILNFNKPLITDVPLKNNKGTAQKFSFTTIADAAGSLAGKAFNLYDAAGPVRPWLSNGVAAAPDVPAGGRLIAVAYVNGDSASVIADKIVTAVDPDAQLIVSADGNKVTITQAFGGVRGAPDAGDTGFSIPAIITAGTNGQLSLKTFKLYDDQGTVAVTFTRAGDVTPDAAEALDRQIIVSVTDSDTAATVAATAAAAIDGDAKFAAVVVAGTNTVRITDSVGGDRTESVDIDTGLQITTNQKGKTLTANFLYDADPGEISGQLEGYWNVTRTKAWNIDFRATTPGSQPTMTLDSGGLSFPNVIEMPWDIATPEMDAKFTAAIALSPNLKYITLTYELKVMFPGQGWKTIVFQDVPVYRTIFNGGITGSIPTVPLVGTNFRITAAPTLQIKDSSSGLFYNVAIVNVGGVFTLDIDQTGVA
jgi:hypothetical protein